MMDAHDRPTADTAFSTDPPHRIERPIMHQEWRDAAFLHWPVDPAEVQSLIPAGLEPDTFDGKAWVGLIPFRMVGIRTPGLPAVPYLGTFPETNVRTYVRDKTGRPGVWFHSLEASRLLPVWTARVAYSLPYMWARMTIEDAEGTYRYAATRRWPGPKGVGGTIAVRPDPQPAGITPLDAFLTARWGLYSANRSGNLRYAPVEHPAWPLYRASVIESPTSLVRAAGYEGTLGDPHALWSPGIPVRVGLPSAVR